MLLNDQVVPATEDQGVTNEPISRAIILFGGLNTGTGYWLVKLLERWTVV